jgi:transcriptional regulator with XRE-family HTH domain
MSVPSWLWASPADREALSSRDLARILRAYRSARGLNQQQLGQMLGVDQSYVSRIETGSRIVRDVQVLEQIARRLGLSPGQVGLAASTDADFDAMCQFAESTIRLASVARRSGRPLDAVAELWPLVARLSARPDGYATDPDVVVLLAEASLALGVTLGDVLPEERLHLSAQWTGHGLELARRLDHPLLCFQALNLHGNELRKGGDYPAAISLFTEAMNIPAAAVLRGDVLVLAARAYSEMGDARGFDASISSARLLLDSSEATPLFNPFSVTEIHVRGMLSTGRHDKALALATQMSPDGGSVGPTSPQWRIMNQITMGGVLLAAGGAQDGLSAIAEAIGTAEECSLPHQIQRAVRLTKDLPGVLASQVTALGNDALRRLRDASSLPIPLMPAHG